MIVILSSDIYYCRERNYHHVTACYIESFKGKMLLFVFFELFLCVI